MKNHCIAIEVKMHLLIYKHDDLHFGACCGFPLVLSPLRIWNLWTEIIKASNPSHKTPLLKSERFGEAEEH